jgi:hypothetical protein
MGGAIPVMALEGNPGPQVPARKQSARIPDAKGSNNDFPLVRGEFDLEVTQTGDGQRKMKSQLHR